jgi:hypothetical protein
MPYFITPWPLRQLHPSWQVTMIPRSKNNWLLYSNRAAASTMMRHYHEALADCHAAIHPYVRYGKAYPRKAQLQLRNGLLDDAIATLPHMTK